MTPATASGPGNTAAQTEGKAARPEAEVRLGTRTVNVSFPHSERGGDGRQDALGPRPARRPVPGSRQGWSDGSPARPVLRQGWAGSGRCSRPATCSRSGRHVAGIGRGSVRRAGPVTAAAAVAGRKVHV
nr:hypothetical protein [Streptomyces toyocaensis]